MEWRLLHTTRYQFESPAQLGPHQVRLLACGPNLARVHSQQLRIWPQPDLDYVREDGWNNRVQQIWFRRPLTSLLISNQLRYRPRPGNPFAFAREGTAERLASDYQIAADYGALFQEWLSCWRQSASDPVSLAVDLNQRTHHRISYRQRTEPGVQSPAETLDLAQGSCRDTAWLVVESLRALGYSARFVSGYWFQLENSAAELHAWAEVYLPGAGWLGLDPTAGLVVDHQHLALARAPRPEETAPVQGSHSAASARLEYRIRLQR